MFVFALGAIIAQQPDPGGQCVVTGDHRAAVAQRTEVLGRIETETGGDAEAAGPAALAGGAMGLRRRERKGVVTGTSVSVRVDLGGRRSKKKKTKANTDEP